MKTKTFAVLSILTSVALSVLAPAKAAVPVAEKTVDYREGTTNLEGFLATPKEVKAGTPAVVVVHEWMGLDSYSKMRARMLAELGYVAFAADIYGKDTRPKNLDEAGEFAGKYKKDLPLLRKRVAAAIAEAAKVPGVDAKKIVVIGYCFGGTAALEAARAKLPVIGAVSFHGGLSTAKPQDTKGLKAKILVLHGADDPLVPAKEVQAFAEEMMAAKADWQFVAYGGAVHKFTNPEVPYKKGAAFGYNEVADKRSWVAMRSFFDEVFAE